VITDPHFGAAGGGACLASTLVLPFAFTVVAFFVVFALFSAE
jgi:hypothetical protein